MLIRALKYAVRSIQIRRNPVSYARKIGVRIGDGSHIYAPSHDMFGSDPYLIRIGRDVHITNGVKFITHDGGTLIFRSRFPDLDYSAPIIIGDNVYLGTNCILLPGVRVGNDCVVAAGAVVARDVPSGSVVGGVPAKFIKTTNEYLLGLQKKSLKCGHFKADDKAKYLKNHYAVDEAWKDL